MDEIAYCICYCGNDVCLKNRLFIDKNLKKRIKWDDFFQCKGFKKLTTMPNSLKHLRTPEFKTEYECIWIGNPNIKEKI